jgi:hypothetical protein
VLLGAHWHGRWSCMTAVMYCVRLPVGSTRLPVATRSGEIPVSRCWKQCLSFGGFFFQSDKIGWSTSYNLFAKSFNHQGVGGRPEASKWTYSFFVQSRFYLDIPQVSHLPSIGPFLLTFSLPLLLLLERQFLLLGFFL